LSIQLSGQIDKTVVVAWPMPWWLNH